MLVCSHNLKAGSYFVIRSGEYKANASLQGLSQPGPSAVQIVLSVDERAELVRRAGLPGRWRADRARIILACAEGMSNAADARALGWRSSRCPSGAPVRRPAAGRALGRCAGRTAEGGTGAG